MTERTVHQTKVQGGESLPEGVEILHAEPTGNSGPLFVWYLESAEENAKTEQ